MQAISEVIEVTEQTIHFKLPGTFKAKRVQIIILPVEETIEVKKKNSRILSLKGSLKGKEGDSLEKHLKEIREEW